MQNSPVSHNENTPVAYLQIIIRRPALDARHTFSSNFWEALGWWVCIMNYITKMKYLLKYKYANTDKKLLKNRKHAIYLM